MKSTIATPTIKEMEITFPCLMEYKENSEYIIVLFNDRKCGTVVYTNCSFYKLGKYSIAWAMEKFKEFKGKLTLENT